MPLWILVVLLAACASSKPKPQKQASQAWLEENLKVMYPEKPREDCIARDANGKLGPCVVDPEVQRRLGLAELAFRDKQFEIADAEYADTASHFPRDYQTLLSWGDAAFFGGRPADALAHYLRAREVNPDDWHAWWYSGRALLVLARKDEALAAFTHALVLNPRRPAMLQTIARDVAHVGYELRSDHFTPVARVDGNTISVVNADARWLGWAICKRASELDSYRAEKHIREPRGEFSLTVERECIRMLLEMDARSKDEPPPDAVVLRLREISKAGMVDGFLDYELGTRSLPYLPNQDPAAAAQMEKFVRAFVLKPAQRGARDGFVLGGDARTLMSR